MLTRVDSLRAECDEHYDAFNYYKAINAIMSRLRDTNALVQETKPWDLAKSGHHDEIQVMLFVVYESLRVCGILLQPIVPVVSAALLDRLNVPLERRSYEFAQVDYVRDKPTSINHNSEVIFKRI